MATIHVRYPSFGYIEYTNDDGNSSYNGLEVSLNKRFSGGLSFLTCYTYSRALGVPNGDQLGSGGSLGIQTNQDFYAQYGPLDFSENPPRSPTIFPSAKAARFLRREAFCLTSWGIGKLAAFLPTIPTCHLLWLPARITDSSDSRPPRIRNESAMVHFQPANAP
jgi:hypothetical protein